MVSNQKVSPHLPLQKIRKSTEIEILKRGVLIHADPSAEESSVVGMVGAENQGQYQVLDAFVDINLESQLVRQSDSQNHHNAQTEEDEPRINHTGGKYTSTLHGP